MSIEEIDKKEEEERISQLKKLIEKHPEEIYNINYEDLKKIEEQLLLEKVKNGELYE